MARITCGISGVSYKCEHVPMTLNKREIAHPIFYLPQRKLLSLYQSYVDGGLSDTDSYLLFVALLHSTDSVSFTVPTIYHSRTQSIIAANIAQLVSVIWKSNAIQHPAFKQPGFYIREDTAELENIKVWIKAWESNIDKFRAGLSSIREAEELKIVENRLTKLIKSPETAAVKLAANIATWADIAAGFPSSKTEYWKATIRKCYNLTAMFSTPKEDLIEIKAYCENNLEVGSLHFHTLMVVLNKGIANHNDFLGLGSSDTPSLGYTLLTSDDTVQEAKLLSIAESAPKSEPVAADYTSKLEFLRARLAYKQAQKLAAAATGIEGRGL